jgi:hypothetical protein
MKTIACILLAAFALSAAPDTDVTGKWSGSFVLKTPEGETRDSTAFLVLKQSGTEITGTVGPNESEQYEIKKGAIEGEKITLLVEAENRIVNFTLAVASDRIKGDVTMSREGQTATAKLDVGRAK